MSKNKPLGWAYGSDGEEVKLGLSFLKSKKLIGQFYIGTLTIGDESIKSEPYKSYLKQSFPSGDVKNFFILRSKFQQRRKIFLTKLILG